MTDKKSGKRVTGHVEGYASAFLDILGWGSRLLQFDTVPDLLADQDRINELVRKPIAQREQMDLAIKTYIKSSRSVSRKEQKEQLAAMSPKYRALGEAMVTNEIIYQSFSDCFVLSTLFGRPLPIAMMATANLLVQCGSLMPILMATRIPVRGGIEVGYGTLTEGEQPELVGASLVKAYKLESQKAGYPRIIIGPELVEVVRQYARMTPTSKDEKIAVGAAQYVDQFLWDEPDGTVALDYLNPIIVSMLDGQHHGVLPAAYEFVQESIASARERRDAKQLGRWSLVRGYFLDRVGRDRLRHNA